MAPLYYAAKFDPFLSLYCARVEGVGVQSNPGIKFCHLATLSSIHQGVGGLTSGIEQAVGTFGGSGCYGYHCRSGGVFSDAINGFVGNTVDGFANGRS